MIKLRPYQTATIDRAREGFRRVNRVLLQSPTGSGKTIMFCQLAESISSRLKRVWILVHRDFLVKQVVDSLRDFDIRAGVIAAGHEPNYMLPVQVAMVQTLANRLDEIPDHLLPNLVIPDEAHHAVDGTQYSKIIARCAKARILGVTATPCRLDGRGLGDSFDVIVKGPSVKWLIENGYLSKFKAFAPVLPDLSKVKKQGKDFGSAAVAEFMDKPHLIGDIIENYKRLAAGKRTIVFCCNIHHAQTITKAFLDAGIIAAQVDGKTDREERDRIHDEFKAGAITVLCSVNIHGEGFDLPALECVVLARPTKSLTLHMQQVGRVLRIDEGKEHGIIIDHAGNLLEHGLPDEVRNWTLDESPKRSISQATGARRCPRCFHLHLTAPTCPGCGHTYTAQDRKIVIIKGKIVEVDAEKLEQLRAKKQKGDGPRTPVIPNWSNGLDVANADGWKYRKMMSLAAADPAKVRERLTDIAKSRGYKETWIRFTAKRFEEYAEKKRS